MAKTKNQTIQKPSKGRIVSVQSGRKDMVGMVYNVQENGLLGVKCTDEAGRDYPINNIPHKSEADPKLRLYWDWPKRNQS